MNDDDRAKAKAVHARMRAVMREVCRGGATKPDGWKGWSYISHRMMLLAWGFVRGFKFRRIERTHHLQTMPDGKVFEHNLPYARSLHDVIVFFDPTVEAADVQRWLDDPSGAIPAPAPRAKKPYTPVAAEE